MKHNDLAASSDNALATLVPDVIRLSRYLARDRDRATAPMQAAVDAVLIDTTDMAIDDAVAAAVAAVAAKMSET